MARQVLVLTAALALLAPLAPASDAAGDDIPERPFRDGNWSGTLAASGVVVGDFPDADALMATTMSGSFDAFVLDGVVSGGVWTLHGSSDGSIDTEFGQGRVGNRYVGSGPVGGDAGGLQLGGAVDTTWDLRIGGQSDTTQDPIRLGPFEVEVLVADCNTLVGRWDHAFETQVAEAGAWEATLAGSLRASHLGNDPADPVADAAVQVIADGQALVTDLTTGALDGPDGTVAIDSALRERVRTLITDANAVEVAIAGLDGNVDCLFPAIEGTFGLTITSLLQEAARVLLREQALDPAGLEFLAEQLLAVGGAGAGAVPDPTVAELEELLAARVSEVLTEAALTDPDSVAEFGCAAALCLPVEPHVLQALRAAELLHQPVTVDGRTHDWAEVHSWLILAEVGQLS